MYVCSCKALREADLKQAVVSGADTPEALVRACGLDDDANCGRCFLMADVLLNRAREAAASAQPMCEPAFRKWSMTEPRLAVADAPIALAG